MAPGIDHVAHAVRDLDEVAAFYRRLGFTVGSRNIHPPVWGTQNNIVQLAGSYIEILGMGDMSMIAPHGPRSFSFGAFAREFIARDEGLAMLALEGQGAADAARFRAAGLGDDETFELSREGRRADGTPVKLAFSLAFTRHTKAPAVKFFTSQHHHPENFWNPLVQSHANTASSIVGVVLVALDPAEHSAFLKAYAQADETQAGAERLFKLSRGTIEVLTPDSFRARFETDAPSSVNGARLAALRFAVRDLEALAAALESGKIRSSRIGPGVVVGPEAAFGATLVFEAI